MGAFGLVILRKDSKVPINDLATLVYPIVSWKKRTIFYPSLSMTHRYGKVPFRRRSGNGRATGGTAGYRLVRIEHYDAANPRITVWISVRYKS